METKTLVVNYLQALKGLDRYTSNPDWNTIPGNIKSFIGSQKPVRLIMFTCSTINDRFLFDQKRPWLYVNLNPTGNNLEPDIKTIRKVLKQLNRIYPTILSIIIGNTDPYYIYLEQRNFNWKQFSLRWRRYKLKLNLWLKSQGLTNYELISWFEYENALKNNLGISFTEIFGNFLPKINQYFKQNDFIREKDRLKLAFGPGKYFPNIKVPGNRLLNRWIRRKFTEYMLQGLFIYLFFPGSVLLQNEKPSLLRTLMYQPLINKFFKCRLPAIYPFGIDNLNYQ